MQCGERAKPSRSNKLASAEVKPFGVGSHFNTIADLSAWPLKMMELLSSGEGGTLRMHRFVQQMANGILVSSFFSGKFSAEVALQMLMVACRILGIAIPDAPMVLWSGCDINAASQSIALENGTEGENLESRSYSRHMHYWGSVQGMIPDDILEVIKAGRPNDSDSWDRKAGSYGAQDSFLKARFRVGPGHFNTKCLVHPGESCPLLPPALSDEEIAAGALVRTHLDFSGPQCLPWCGSGNRLGAADRTMESYHCYTSLVRTPYIPWKFLENAANFPFDMWVRDVASGEPTEAISKMVVFGPNNIGFPTLRLRLLGFFCEDPRFEWCGPSQQDCTDDFLRIFGATPGLYATDFAGLDEESERERLYKNMAKLRGIFSLPAGRKFCNLAIEDVVPICFRRHLKEYRRLAGLTAEKVLLVDLATDPVERPGRHGLVSPTSTQNTTLAKVTASGEGDLLLTPREIDLMHGWPFLNDSARFASCLPFPAGLQLSHRELKSFTGNGQHLACMGAWYLYVLAHIAFK